MQPFVLNRHGRLVFPGNFSPDLDFSVIDDEAQLDSVIRRDFETKAPSGTEIGERIARGAYADRMQLMRDVALNLFWVNRFAMTMYEKVPTRWRDVPRTREDVYLPVVEDWFDKDIKVTAVERAFGELPTGPDPATEERIFAVLFDVFRHRKHRANALEAIRPTVAQAAADPANLTFHLVDYDPEFPKYSYDDILDAEEDVAELEALHRWAMVLHNQYPWNREKVQLTAIGDLKDDDVVLVFKPRNAEVVRFLHRVRTRAARNGGADGQQVTDERSASGPPEGAAASGAAGKSATQKAPTQTVPTQTAPPKAAAPESKQPIRPYPAIDVRRHFRVQPKVESLAVVRGEYVCSNDDLIRNTAYCWSPMTAKEISDKTGIEQRLYSARGLDELALDAATAALERSGRTAEEIGAVVFCSCTSTRMMPSMATWLSGQLGMYQTHCSVDLVAACAGLPYGLAEATRLLQEVDRPVLLVCGEKFSDKIGTVRPSRMIFGDGAAAMVIAPAAEGEDSDIDLLQTYASGPVSQVNSIIWPNPAFDNNITVYGPEVKALAGRYLSQMITELEGLEDPNGKAETAWDTVELVVPHQANKTMVIGLAAKAGLAEDRLYFDIEKVGNTSSASIPIAIADAVQDGVIDRPMKIFAPGFGAGAVGGYAVLRIDPAVVVTENGVHHAADPAAEPAARAEGSADDVTLAFGG